MQRLSIPLHLSRMLRYQGTPNGNLASFHIYILIKSNESENQNSTPQGSSVSSIEITYVANQSKTILLI